MRRSHKMTLRHLSHLLLALVFVLTATTLPAAGPAPRTDGYRGIWFTLGQFYGKGSGGAPYSKPTRTPTFPYGDKYSGGLGTYTAKHTPLAIYAPQADKTFFVYGGTTGSGDRHLLCMVGYYDHKTGLVPKPAVVYDKNGVDDPHDNPSLSIDKTGHLWVTVSGRGRSRPGFKFRSTEPYSIGAFDQVTEEELTYPQPHILPGGTHLHLFTKYTGVRELYWETSTDGTDWTPDQKLAGIREPGHSKGGHYQTSARHGNTVATFFNRHPNGNVDQRTDLYYLQTTDAGKTWTTVTGETLTTPLTDLTSPARVIDYASQNLNVYLKDMGFDHHGHPVILYLTSPGHQPGPPNDPRHFRITRWTGTAWHTHTVCTTDHNYDMGSLYLEPGRWLARLPSGDGPQPGHAGGELVDWASTDHGKTWTRTTQLTTDSPRNHNYARRPINAKDPFYTFWADGDPTRASESHLYFADSTGQKIHRLPYTMDGPARPELASTTPLETGWASADITPPAGMRLCGSFDEKISTGTHDPLHVRAFVFRQGDTTAALAGCDLAMLFPHIGDAVRNNLKSLGLEPGNVLLHASETHNGPDYHGEFRDVFHHRAVAEHGHDPAEPLDYSAFLIDKITDAITAAHNNLAPVDLSYSETTVPDIAFNRRFEMADGSVGWNPGKLNPAIVKPLGPVDERLPILTLQRPGSASPDAILTSFALHLAVLNDREYAADYPYYLSRHLHQNLPSKPFTHFLQAPCCEINHIDTSTKTPQTGHPWADHIGTTLANATLATLPEAEPLQPALRTAHTTVDLQLQSFSEAETAAARTLWHDPDRASRPFLEVVRAGKIAAIADRHHSRPIPVLLQAIQLSPDTAVLGLPGEVSVELGLLIRKHSPYQNTLIVQLSNDWFGYIPSQKIFTQGHYEAEVAKIQHGQGEHLAEAAITLLTTLTRQ